MIHMQVALYALFLRLYGMFPCNFLAYLRTQYKDKNKPVFIHTIKVIFSLFFSNTKYLKQTHHCIINKDGVEKQKASLAPVNLCEQC